MKRPSALPSRAGGADVKRHPGPRQMHDECRVLYGSHTVGACTGTPLQPTHRQVPSKSFPPRPSVCDNTRRTWYGIGLLTSEDLMSEQQSGADKSLAQQTSPYGYAYWEWVTREDPEYAK